MRAKERRGSTEAEVTSAPRRGRGLLALLSLALLAAVAALLSASRRSQFERRWEDLADVEPPEPEPQPERPAPIVPSVERQVAGRAGALFVDDGGLDGQPILFVHSLGGTSRQWRAQLTHLRPGRRTLALDLRGHGDSDRAPAEAYRVEDLTADLAATADELGLDRFVLAGHSLGATVAIDYAGRHAERISGLLLVDPNGDQTELPRAELDRFLEALRRDARGEMEWYFRQLLVGSEPEVADQVLSDLALADPAALVGALESSFTYSPRPALARYPGPKLSVVSDLNNLPVSLHNLVLDLPYKLVVGTSHWLMMDRPEVFAGILDDFLASLS